MQWLTPVALLLVYRVSPVGDQKGITVLKGHSDAVACVTFAPGEKTLASGSLDKTVKLWNVETGKEIRSLAVHTSIVGALTFSPDGASLAACGGSDQYWIKVWSSTTG